MKTPRIEKMEKTLENLSFWNVLDIDEQWELRTALDGTRRAGIDEAVEVVDGIRNNEDVRAHQSNDNFKHYAVVVLDRVKEALQDNK